MLPDPYLYTTSLQVGSHYEGRFKLINFLPYLFGKAINIIVAEHFMRCFFKNMIGPYYRSGIKNKVMRGHEGNSIAFRL